MTDLMRRAGFGLMVLGGLLVLFWALDPFIMLWPWFRSLPTPIKVGVGAAAVGVSILFASMVIERVGESKNDRNLREEELT